MSAEPLVVGIEGGGTRTRGWLARGGPDKPRVLADRETEGSNLQTTGSRKLGQLVTHLVEALAADAGVRLAEVRAIGLGLAGVGTPEDRLAVIEALRSHGVALPALVVSDARAALEGATSGWGGVLVIAGTGSIAIGFSRDGREARSGGWGHQLGDEGSGYALGRALLSRVTQGLDGRLARSTSVEVVREHLMLPDHAALAAWIRAHAADTRAVAALAPLLLAAATKGNRFAVSTLEQGAGELAAMARAVQRQLGLPAATQVVLYGGLLRGSDLYRQATIQAVERRMPAALVQLGLADSGLRGCVRLAHRALEERRAA